MPLPITCVAMLGIKCPFLGSKLKLNNSSSTNFLTPNFLMFLIMPFLKWWSILFFAFGLGYLSDTKKESYILGFSPQNVR